MLEGLLPELFDEDDEDVGVGAHPGVSVSHEVGLGGNVQSDDGDADTDGAVSTLLGKVGANMSSPPPPPPPPGVADVGDSTETALGDPLLLLKVGKMVAVAEEEAGTGEAVVRAPSAGICVAFSSCRNRESWSHW